MKYFSFRCRAFLAVGAALIAFSTPSALHAQSVSYGNGGQNSNAPGSVSVIHQGGSQQPGLVQGGHQVYVAPPLVRGPAPSGPAPATGWVGQGYNQGFNQGYNQGYNQGPSYGVIYPRIPYGYGTTSYQPPFQGQVYARQPVRQPIPDAIQPAGPAQPMPQGVVSAPSPHTVNVYAFPKQFVQTNVPDWRHHHDDNFLGGFYFGNYVDTFDGAGSYLSAYSYYPGVPEYIYEPNGSVVVFDPPVVSPFVGNYIDFDSSAYINNQIADLYQYQQLATTDNPFLYHGPAVLSNPYAPPPAQAPSQDQQQQTAPPPADQNQQPQQAPAPAVVPPAAPQYQPGSYKEAFADIESSWINGDVDSIRKHLRDNDLKIAVSLNGKYSYSIASGDWADITRDAQDHLQTVSFEFTLLRFQKNGDITGYAKHDYTAESKDGDKQDTMYLSYTLRHRDNMWYIVDVDTSTKPLIPEQKDQPAASSDQPAPAKGG